MGIAQSAFPHRHFGNLLGRYHPDARHPMTPIVSMNTLVGNTSKHPAILRLGVRRVLTQRGDDVNVTRPRQEPVESFRNPSGTAMSAGQIGGKQQDSPEIAAQARPCLLQQLGAERLNLAPGNHVGFAIEPRHS